MQSPFYDMIHEGMDVLDSSGERVGRAGDPLGDFFNVNDDFIPFTGVDHVTHDVVVLNVRKDELEPMGWRHGARVEAP